MLFGMSLWCSTMYILWNMYHSWLIKKQTNKQKPKILVMYNSALCLLNFIIYMASAHFTEVCWLLWPKKFSLNLSNCQACQKIFWKEVKSFQKFLCETHQKCPKQFLWRQFHIGLLPCGIEIQSHSRAAVFKTVGLSSLARLPRPKKSWRICDVIKQNQSEVGNIDFKIEPHKAENVFCFLLFFCILQLLISLEPIAPISMGFSAKCSCENGAYG